MEHLPLTLVVSFLIGLVASQQGDHLLTYRNSDASKRVRRTAADNKQHKEYVEEKLAQHSQALEHLIKLAENSEELTNRLVENLAKIGEKPKLPERFEPPKQTRRSNSEVVKADNVNIVDKVQTNVKEAFEPVVKYVKAVPKAGLLTKKLLLNMFQPRKDAVPLVERKGEGDKANQTILDLPEETRRSFQSTNLGLVQPSGPPLKLPNSDNPWCREALLCKKDNVPVCGYDTGYGYGKFEDMCHLFQVNCYWNLKFSVSPVACRPIS